MSFVNINGRLLPADAAVAGAGNRSLRYGYGLFETMLIKEGRIRLGEYHWERLMAGMEALEIPAGRFFRETLEKELWRTVRRARLEPLCRVRLQVYAGDGGLYDGDFSAGFIIEVFSVEAHFLELNETGLVAGMAAAVKATGATAAIKTTSALPYALAAREAKRRRWNDALLCNEHGRLAESTIGNVWIAMGDTICTPPLSEGCIAGVMRRYLLEALPGAGFRVEERAITTAQLQRADGVFISNAIRGLRWVADVDGARYGPSASGNIHQAVLQNR